MSGQKTSMSIIKSELRFSYIDSHCNASPLIKATVHSWEVSSPLLGGSHLGITHSGHEGPGCVLYLAQFNLIPFEQAFIEHLQSSTCYSSCLIQIAI